MIVTRSDIIFILKRRIVSIFYLDDLKEPPAEWSHKFQIVNLSRWMVLDIHPNSKKPNHKTETPLLYFLIWINYFPRLIVYLHGNFFKL